MSLEEIIRKFKSVKIIHDIIHRIDYSYLAEFFRFMGVFVCEDILPESAGEDDKESFAAERSTVYNAYIFIGEEKGETVRLLPENHISLYDALETMQCLNQDKNDDISSKQIIGRLPEEIQKGIIYELLTLVFREVCADRGQETTIAEQMRELIDVYVKNDLWYHSMNLQYYRNRGSEAVTEAKKALLESHNAVRDLLDKKDGLPVIPWYKYAWLWCEWKVDAACDYAHDPLYFSVDNLSGRCRKLSVEYPWFSNVKVLLGLSYETVPNRTNDALDAFNDALKDIKDECFAAPVYYWMGKRFEVYPDRIEHAKRCYQLAERSKPKFRTNFKLAMIAMAEEEYDSEILLLEKIIGRLNLKMKMKFADPLELEYLFKSYVQQCYAFNKSGKNTKAVEAAKKAEQIRNISIDENHYFDMFYGGDADSFRKLSKDRMNPTVVEWLKNDSFRQCGEGMARVIYWK